MGYWLLVMNRCYLFASLLMACCAPQGGEPDFADMINSHGLANGCSWYCGCPGVTVQATSTVGSLRAAALHDAKAESIWIAGEAGRQTITFGFDMTHEEYGVGNPYGIGVDWVSIINGDARSKRKWKAHARAKTLKLHFNGKLMKQIEFADTMEPQRFDLPKMLFVGAKVNELSFEVIEFYPGSRSQRVAMADFYFSGFGQIH